ncbi:MAG: sulfite exporter TauE/SafE family protein [Syntrophus sp. (in: bacteria)]
MPKLKGIMETLPYLIIIMLLAGFIQGFSGFGSVLLSLPLLALFMDVKTAIPLVAIMGVLLTILLLIPLWKELEWQRIWPLLAGAAPGIPLGVFMLKFMDGRFILTLLGLILVCYSLYSLLFPVIRRELGSIWAYLI